MGYGIYVDDDGKEHLLPIKINEDGEQICEIKGITLDVGQIIVDTSLLSTSAKQDILKGVLDNIKIGTDKIPSNPATAANQRLVIVTKDITSADLTDNAYTFTEAVDAVAVKNDGTSDLTITISTLLFTIKPGESRIIEMASFTVTTFSASAVFRMNGLRRSG